MKPSKGNVARQTRFAKSLYGDLPESAIEALKELLERQFSVLNGDLKYLESGWYVTHSGLLRLAKRRHCVGIHARLVPVRAIRQTLDGYSRRSYSNHGPVRASLATVMPIPRMFLPWSVA